VRDEVNDLLHINAFDWLFHTPYQWKQDRRHARYAIEPLQTLLQ
jgi:hypothetical protein